MSIVNELETLHKELVDYYRLVQLSKKGTLSQTGKHRLSELYWILVQKVGQYKGLVIEITGMNEVIIPINYKELKTDIWAVSFQSPPVIRTPIAINHCITAVGQAIGKLKDDIAVGKRDEQGNLIGNTVIPRTESPKAFISHGKGGGALVKLETFVAELGVIPIVVKDQPNLDRSVDKKVEDCLNEADFVIILATGDDEIANKPSIKQPRQNVIHEIGLAQKTHAGKIIYLLEEGTEFPSNIKPKVYESFARQSMDGAFTAIVREMRELGFLKVVTPVKTKE